MMQSGLSRELFEMWCTDPKNGCIVAGYCVEGTLAKHILSEPEEIQTMTGTRLKLKMDVSYISFSAHTDYRQTSGFIRALRPPHVVLVHGEGEYFKIFCNITTSLQGNSWCQYYKFIMTDQNLYTSQNSIASYIIFYLTS